MSNVIPHDAETSIAQRPSINTGIAQTMTGRTETAKALIAAIQSCHGVGKDKENLHHHYKYASAEAVFEAGRQALLGAGLALLPIEASLNGYEREGPDRYELVRTFMLMHVSGEMTPLRVAWPVCPEKGRPLDKATAAADTLSLSYLLRDLLLMPRVDAEADINTRDDRPERTDRRQRPPDQDNGKKPPPSTGVELRVAVNNAERRWVADGLCKLGTVGPQMHAWAREEMGCELPMDEWPADVVAAGCDQLKAIRSQLREAKLPIGTDDQARLASMLARKGRKWSAVIRAHNLPDNASAKDLSRGLYDTIMRQLEEEPDADSARK